jgi:adenine phosphoribosyltransferase
MYLNDIKSGERVVIIDDVLSTGGTIRAIIDGIEKTGAQIMHVITVVEKGPGLEKLQQEYPNIKIESLVRLEMDGANIVILE